MDLNVVHTTLSGTIQVGGDTKRSSYVDPWFNIATSNLCERLFSIASYALNDRRKEVLPAKIKMQRFLHVKAFLWELSDVHEILQ